MNFWQDNQQQQDLEERHYPFCRAGLSELNCAWINHRAAPMVAIELSPQIGKTENIRFLRGSKSFILGRFEKHDWFGGGKEKGEDPRTGTLQKMAIRLPPFFQTSEIFWPERTYISIRRRLLQSTRDRTYQSSPETF